MLNVIKLLKINQILFISWIINFFLIGKFISPINIDNLLNIKYLIDIRGNLVIFSIAINTFILLFLIFCQKKITAANFLGLLFLIFSIIQTISYIYSLEEYNKKINYNLFFFLTHIFFTIAPTLIVINILLINNNKLFQNIIKFSIATISLFIFLIIIKSENIRPNMSVPIFNFELININVNGFSRLILMVYFVILIIFIEKKINSISKIILLAAIILINYFFLILQSRSTILLCVVGSIIAIMLEKNKKIYKKIVTLVFIFGIPILTYSLNNNLKQNRIYYLQGEKYSLKIINDEKREQQYKKNIFEEADVISTGRINKWIFITEEIYSNVSYILLGRGGPQVDRLIFAEKFTVFQEKKPFLNDNSSYKKDFFVQGQDVANGALYSFASAGILGLIIYFSIIFLLIFLLYKILVNFDKNYSYIKSSDIYFKYSSLVSLILILRSFLENGFMVWGIDQLFFILCASYVCNYYYFFKQKNL